MTEDGIPRHSQLPPEGGSYEFVEEDRRYPRSEFDGVHLNIRVSYRTILLFVVGFNVTQAVVERIVKSDFAEHLFGLIS